MLNKNEEIMGLTDRTGRGVVVGIIDSGIDISDNKLMNHCKAGGAVLEHEGDLQFVPNEYADIMGHGTAIANIILKKASDVSLYIVKIFHDSLICNSDQLSLAIKKCVEFGCHVINISAGLINSEPELMKVTQMAAQYSHLVCACSNQNGITFYPATYSWCFGVASGNCRKKFDYYYNKDKEIEFIARGDQQRLTWLCGTQVFMGGASFAAAHVSAIISLLLEEDPDMNRDMLNDRLSFYSMSTPPQIVHIVNDSYSSPYIVSDSDKNNLKEDFFQHSMYKLNRVIVKGNVASFFERIGKYLDYEIVDISDDLDLNLEKTYDAVIIADDGENTDKQLSLEAQVVKQGKRVFYFTPDLNRKKRRMNCLDWDLNSIREPIAEHEAIVRLIEKYPYVARHGVRCPIAGFFAADYSLESHVYFAKLCFALRHRGYKVAIFDGTADSLLYGGDASFPCNSYSKIETDFSNYVPSIRSIMQITDISGDYDIIMVYNTGHLQQNGDVNATIRFVAFLIGALIEGYFYFGIPEKNELNLISEITKAPLIQLIKSPLYSDNMINRSVDSLINYFK